MTEKNKKPVSKQVVLPIMEALKMSVRSIKVRFGRVVIVSSSVFLGVAFLMSILSNSAITRALIDKAPDQISLGLLSEAEDSFARDIWLVSLSLLVCVVGITNSMLMAVSERSREIGTMKCLGALNRFIMEIFLIEAALQGLLGSLTGGLVGGLVSVFTFAGRFGGEVFRYLPYLGLLKYLIISTVLGTFIAIVGAIYPTYLSARMEPAEAIRREV